MSSMRPPIGFDILHPASFSKVVVTVVYEESPFVVANSAAAASS